MVLPLLACVFEIAVLSSAPPPLPTAAKMRLGSMRFFHRESITWVQFGHDAKTVLTASHENQLLYWDVATGRQVARLPCYPFHGTTFACSGDGKRLLIPNHETAEVQLVDTQQRRTVRRLTVQDLYGSAEAPLIAERFTLSRDGRYLALWDYAGTSISAGDDRKRPPPFLYVLDTHTGRRIRSWKTPALHHLTFSVDGKTVSGLGFDERSQSSVVHSWEIDSGRPLPRVVLARPIQNLVSVPGDSRLIGAGRESLHEYDLKTGKERRNLAHGRGPIYAFALSADGKRLAIVQEARLVVQRLDDGQKMLDVGVPGHLVGADFFWSEAQHLAFSPDGATIALALGRKVELWHVPTGKCTTEARWGGSVLGLQAHGSHVLLRDIDMNLSLWDLRHNRMVQRYPAGMPTSEQVERRERETFDLLRWSGSYQAFSPDGKRIAALWFNTPIRVFDHAGQNAVVLEGSETSLCVAFSPDGKFVAGQGTDKQVWIWNTSTGKRVRQLLFPGGAPPYLSVHFSRDGRFLAASAWGGVLIWELTSETLRVRDVARSRWLRNGQSLESVANADLFDNFTVAFLDAPDGKHLAAVGPRHIRMLRLFDGKEMHRFGGADVVGPSAAFSPDGKYLVAGLDSGGMRIWDAVTYKVVRKVPAHAAGITTLAFTDCQTLVAAALDGSVITWDFDRLLQVPNSDTANLEAHWQSLTVVDADKALPAAQALVARPREAVALLTQRLRPVPHVAPQHITKLTANLQSSQFPVRQAASMDLEQLGGQARAALEETLKKAHSIEVRRRIEALLEKLELPISAPALLQQLRAIEVLEQIATPEAQHLLESLAAGGRGHRITEDAQAALKRLNQR